MTRGGSLARMPDEQIAREAAWPFQDFESFHAKNSWDPHDSDATRAPFGGMSLRKRGYDDAATAEASFESWVNAVVPPALVPQGSRDCATLADGDWERPLLCAGNCNRVL